MDINLNDKFWRNLTNFWSIISFFAIAYDFIYNNALGESLGPILAIYVASLAIYAGGKEFGRWHHMHKGRHPGEAFVILLTALIVFVIFGDFIFKKSYQFPSELISAYITILGIFALTKKSKSFYRVIHIK